MPTHRGRPIPRLLEMTRAQFREGTRRQPTHRKEEKP